MGQTLPEPNKEKYTSEGNDKKVMYGASCMQGWRASKYKLNVHITNAPTLLLRFIDMEDAHTALTSYANTGASFFAVFDGHGGI